MKAADESMTKSEKEKKNKGIASGFLNLFKRGKKNPKKEAQTARERFGSKKNRNTVNDIAQT